MLNLPVITSIIKIILNGLKIMKARFYEDLRQKGGSLHYIPICLAGRRIILTHTHTHIKD